MTHPIALKEFKNVTQMFYMVYFMANKSMDSYGEDFAKMDGYNPKGVTQVGDIARVGSDQMVSSMAFDGAYSQIISHGIIVWIYTLWESEYRRKIADELGVDKGSLKSHVAGDLRELRHMIGHRNPIVGENDLKKLKVFTWIEKGPLALNNNNMQDIQVAINKMTVYIEEPE